MPEFRRLGLVQECLQGHSRQVDDGGQEQEYGEHETKQEHCGYEPWRHVPAVEVAFYLLHFVHVRCRERFHLPDQQVEGDDDGALGNDDGRYPKRKPPGIVDQRECNVNGKDQADSEREGPAVHEERVDKQPGKPGCACGYADLF